MAKNAEVRSGTSSIIRLAKNLLLGIAEDVEDSAMVIMMIMKRSKNHFLTSQADLQSILPLYALKKDEFSLIVLAINEAFN